MLNSSLVSYSDSDSSEKEVESAEVWIQSDNNVRILVRQTDSNTTKLQKKAFQLMKKPEQRFYVPPADRGTFTTFPSPVPLSRKENADSSSSCSALRAAKEAADSSTRTPSSSQFSSMSYKPLPVCDIPLPRESAVNSTDISPKSKKSKHAAMAVYVPPKQRDCTSRTFSSGDDLKLNTSISPDNQTSVFSDTKTPTRRKLQEASPTTNSYSTPVGSWLKRKGEPLVSPDIKKRETASAASRSVEASKIGQELFVKRSLYSALPVKGEDWSSPNTNEKVRSLDPLSTVTMGTRSPEVSDESVPKKVTLKPFWMFCPPPSLPLTSIGLGDAHGTFHSDYISLISGPTSAPAYSSTSGSKLSPHTPDFVPRNASYSSLPDMSNCSSVGNDSNIASGSQHSLSSTGWSSKSSSWKWCHGSEHGCSSADVSPATSLSSISLDVSNADNDVVFKRIRPSLSRPLGQSRQRIHSVPQRLQGRISLDNRLSTSLNNLKDSPPTSPSVWKSNFSRKYCNFTQEFIDSHCHLDFLYRREGFAGTFQKYRNTHYETFPPNFAGCVAVFCEPQSFNPKGGLWKDLLVEDKVWVAMGCHPKCVTDYTSRTEEALTACLSSHPKVIAAGEFGLDYSGRFSETADKQKDVFVRQLKIALALDKPLVVHCRKAEDDTFDILEKYVPKHVRIHRHCFTDTMESAERWLNTFPNLFVGLTPLVTYKTAVETHDLARKIPLNRLLLETDAPYFVPHCIPRGEMTLSHPGMAITVAEQVAYYRDIPVNEVLRATRENTVKMYGV